MKGDVQNSLSVEKITCMISEVFDYGTDSGFYLIPWNKPSKLQLQKVRSVVLQLINGLMHIGQRSVALLFFK